MPIAPPPKPIAPFPGPPASVPGKKQPDIVVIPDKYYGMALKMDAVVQKEETKPLPPPPPPKPAAQIVMPPEKKSVLPMVGLIVVLLLVIAGGFVYFERDLLFKQPTPVTPPPTPVVVAPPSAPANLIAKAAGSSAVALTWTDNSGEETGYRIERKEAPGTFLPITSVPANSTAFLDVSTEAGKTYSYRVVAVGEGGESAPSNESIATVAEAPIPPAPAPTLPPGGLDSDSDGLTDVEEQLYGTSITNPDTDGDHYLDGNEVFHLYNPIVPAPAKLTDSTLIKQITSPAGWSLYIPSIWTSSLDTPDGTRATINVVSGELFHLSIDDNADHVSLSDWIVAKTPGTVAADLRAFTTKSGLEGMFSKDRMTAYFSWTDKVLVIEYNLASQKFVNYRTTFEMMLNSLKLEGAPVFPVNLNPATTGPGTLLGTTSTEATTTSETTSTIPSSETTSTTSTTGS